MRPTWRGSWMLKAAFLSGSLALFDGARLPAQAAPVLVRGPFLGTGSATTQLIAWRTAAPSAGAIQYGLDLSYGHEVADPTVSPDHALTLSDLAPGTRYRYRVLAAGSVVAEGLSFATAPDPSSPSPSYRFVALGDTGSGGLPQIEVAARIAALSPDFAIHIGDLAYPGGAPGDLDDKYFGIYRDLISRVPIYLSLGNKEVQFDGGAAFIDSFHLPENSPDPERYYSFVYGNALFVALDTNQSLPGSRQLLWLESELRTTDRLWKVVFFHHPVYSSAGSDPALAGALEPLFDRFHVDLVIHGHTHFYERTYPMKAGVRTDEGQEPDYLEPKGTVYLVTGGGGGVLITATPGPFSASYRSTYHFLSFQVKGADLTLEAIDRTGALLDRMTIRKNPPSSPLFKRGDVDLNGVIDLTDPVALLSYLFLGTPASECFDAADVDDSGDLTLTDAIVSLTWQFLGGPPPPAPGPAGCGPDPTKAEPPFPPCVYPPESCR
jgi:hypothetical protein